MAVTFNDSTWIDLHSGTVPPLANVNLAELLSGGNNRLVISRSWLSFLEGVVEKFGVENFMKVVKSLLFAALLVLLTIAFAGAVSRLEQVIGIKIFQSLVSTVSGITFLFVGFVLRFWSALLFYQNKIKVICLKPQKTLITSGPYRISRNPLYLGIVCMATGSGLLFGSPMMLLLSAIIFVICDLWIRREEKDLERDFGEEYLRYQSNVPRWLKLRF